MPGLARAFLPASVRVERRCLRISASCVARSKYSCSARSLSCVWQLQPYSKPTSLYLSTHGFAAGHHSRCDWCRPFGLNGALQHLFLALDVDKSAILLLQSTHFELKREFAEGQAVTLFSNLVLASRPRFQRNLKALSSPATPGQRCPALPEHAVAGCPPSAPRRLEASAQRLSRHH